MTAPPFTINLAKEIGKVLKSLESESNGQATISQLDLDNIRQIRVTIQPNDGLYKGFRCEFQLYVPLTYPVEPPEVTCLTDIYHPNISAYGEPNNVCLNLFDADWEPTFRLEHCIQGLLFLMHNPNLEDPLNYKVMGLNETEFRKNVSKWMKNVNTGNGSTSVVEHHQSRSRNLRTSLASWFRNRRNNFGKFGRWIRRHEA